MTYVLTPTPKQKFFDNNGNVAVNAQVFTYQAGTTNKAQTYSSSGGSANANPIILNARGECDLWLLPNTSYKFTLSPSTDTDPPSAPWWTVDNIINSQLITLYGGVDSGVANAYVLTFAANFSSYADGTVIYWIPSASNTGASTLNVNGLGIVSIVTPAGAALGANQIVANQMTEVIYKSGQFQLFGIGTITGNTVGTFGAESTVASAATADLGTATAHVVNVTGAVTITSFGSTAQLVAPIYSVRFTGAPLITYNASSLITPGGVNIQAGAGDTALMQYLGGGNWKVLNYQVNAVVQWRGNASDITTGLLPLVQTPVGSVGGAAKNLIISTTGANANVSVTFDEVVVKTSAYVSTAVQAGSLTIAMTGSGANGLDTGTVVASTWYAIWVIWNGTTIAGLASTQYTLAGIQATLPTGYTYAARVGWIQTDGTGSKYPLHFIQYGRRAQYVVAGSGNVTAPPLIDANPHASYTGFPVAAFVPVTASKIIVNGWVNNNTILVAPNSSYATSISTYSSQPPLGLSSPQATAQQAEIVLESTSIYYIASGSAHATSLTCMGWEDNL